MPTYRPIPESIPRQKACMYLLLIGLTSVLIFFYSYPLSMEIIRQKITYSIRFNRKDLTSSSLIIANETKNTHISSSKILQKLFFTSKNTELDSRTTTTTDKSTKLTFVSKSVSSVLFTANLTAGHESNTKQEKEDPTISPETQFEDLPELPNESSEFLTINSNTMKEVQSQDRSRDLSKSISTSRFDGTRLYNDSTKNTASDEIQNNNEPKNELVKFSRTSVGKKSTKELPAKTTDKFVIKETGKQNLVTSEATSGNQLSTMTIVSKGQEEGSLTSNPPLLKNKPLESPTTVQSKNFAKSSNGNEKEKLLPSLPTHRNSSESKTLQNVSGATTDSLSNVRKEYLVFSEHCRIPNIDPMDPSIVHLVEKTPPLDCSEEYKPLAWTEGHTLYLNKTAVEQKTEGDNYTCCFRSVFRENDGKSDNDYGFGAECHKISDKETVKDEFVKVECKYLNGTEFYKEFHSFIFDKPEVEERCNNHNDSQYSVLIVGVDSVSRLNMHRQLNATVTYLLKEMEATEMYGYNKVGDNTFPNLIPLMTGYDERELPIACWNSTDLPLDKCHYLWNRFSAEGYRTLYAEDSPHISTFNYVKKGFYFQPTDYYIRPFILSYEDALGRDKPLNCYQCVGSTSETEAILNWVEQFASHFSNRSYFSFAWINSLTHDFMNKGSSADHMYLKFFRTLHQTGALDKTIVVLMSDHGMRWGSIRNTYVGRLEERLPMLIVALPKIFSQDYPQFANTLRENSRRLITPFDLHATLLNLLNLTENWSLDDAIGVSAELSNNFTMRAQSLFQPVPVGRSCDDAFIEEHWCTCEASIEVDIHRQEIKDVAMFLLKQINNLLKLSIEKCAVLSLNSISDARLWQPPAEHTGHSADDRIYTVVIHTNPSKAVFEGTVKTTKTNKELLGTISRLNLYGNQSLKCQNFVIEFLHTVSVFSW